MNRRRITAGLICLTLLMTLLLAACGGRVLSPEEEALCGRWAYNHDPGKAVLTLKKNGSADYEGNRYDFTCDGQYIRLTDRKGDILDLRYQMENGGMILYIPTEYQCEGSPDGLVGLWRCEPKNWSFEFKADGTFSEDGAFTGHYITDEEAGTFTLNYLEPFDDATCHYTLNGDVLTVEYPWAMVPTD